MVKRKPIVEIVEDIVSEDVEKARLRAENNRLKRQYRAALKAVDDERTRSDAILDLSSVSASGKKARVKKPIKSEATAVILLSDWHVEERVLPESVNNINDVTLEVIDRRLDELSSRIKFLIEHERQIASIDRIVVACLGDFISNIIHDDTAELAQLAPLAATRWAGQRLRSIIDLAATLAKEVVVVTAVGNHGRSVMKPRIATEHDHSFEQNLYLTMAANEQNKNVVWQVGESYINLLDVQGYRIAFHHGHGVKGNVHTGAAKAIAKWQQTVPADLHCFGHHHQFAFLRNKYIANGSVIGYNAYALRICAEAEPPSQSLAVICHHRNECTRAIPIFCDSDLQESKKCQKSQSQLPLQQSKVGTSRVSKKQTKRSGKVSKKRAKQKL